MKFISSIIFFIALTILLGLMYLYAEVSNSSDKIIHYKPKLTTRIYDKNEILLANIFEEHHRFYATYDEIPTRLIEALVAIEDTTFFEHYGINIEAIFRAIIKDIKAMKLVEGASTITQQLVKNLVLSREKKIVRKIKEMLIAFKIETLLTKEQILERYLNEVFFGHGYYGVKTAALGYFRKRLDELSLKEMAILVGLPKAPSSYDPTKHLVLSLGRANTVLGRMKKLGWISEEMYKQATAEVPKIYDDTLSKNQSPFIVDEAIKQGMRLYDDFKTGGYKVYLSIDLDLQEKAQESLIKGHDNIIKRNKDINATNLEGAMVVMENETGNVLALVGGVDYQKSSFNRAIQSKRQPGSSFKPFVYMVALNQGYSTQSKIADISRTYDMQDKDEKWKPKNYGGNFKGLITLKDAITKSVNLATINLVNSIGLDTLKLKLESYGFKNLPFDLSLSLGSFGISLYDFAGFYSIFSNYGKKVEPRIITKVIDFKGNIKEFQPVYTQITSPEQSFLVIDMLRNVVSSGTGRGAYLKDIQIAGKTGTTNDTVDALFCGFTPEVEVLIWYGNDDNTPIAKRETGGRAATPVFKDFISYYIKKFPQTKRVFDKPDNVREVRIKNKTEYFTKQSPLPKKTNQNYGIDDDVLF